MVFSHCGLVLFPIFFFAPLGAQVVVTPGIDTNLVRQLIAQPGLNIANVVINCDSTAYGEFAGTSELPMTHGIAISTGKLSDAFSSNNAENTTTAFLTADTIPGLQPTNDACSIEFDAQSNTNVIRFIFSFGSEEYPEYVYSAFNDVFVILVNGPRPGGGNYINLNFAYLPDSSSTCINHVNNTMNMEVFYDNTFPHGRQIEYDGLTSYLTATIEVIPDSMYHFVFAIADQDDPYFDSGGFIAAHDSYNHPLPVMPASGVDCYPNPVIDKLEWLPTEGLGISSAKLYDEVGRLVYDVADPMEQRSIDMRSYSCGMYVLHIETTFFKYTFRIVKL